MEDVTKPAEVQVSHPVAFATLPLTEELKKQAKEAMIKRFDGVKADREKKFKEYDQIDKLYTANTSGDKDTLANVMTLDGFNSVEDWVALEIDAMFPSDPWFDLQGSKSPLDPIKKEKIKKVLQRNNRRTEFELEHEDVARQGFKYGTLVSKITYQVEEESAIRLVNQPKMVGEMQAKDENGKPLTEDVIEEYIDEEDYTAYRKISLRNLYFRKDKLNWVIELINSSWSFINRNENLFENLEAARKTSIQDKKDYQLDDDVEIMEGHMIPLDIEGKKVLCLIVMINREEVVRVLPYPYQKLAYRFTQFFVDEGVEGRGLIDLLKRMLLEINTRRTQALDANTHGLYGMKAVNMRYIKKPEQLRIRKDGLIELKETDKPIDQIIQFYRPPVEYASIAMGLMDKITFDIQRSTRLKGVLAGEKISPNPSVSEYQGMMKEALKSVKVILRRIARTQIEEYLEQAYYNGIMNRSKSWQIPIKKTIMVPKPPPIDPMTGQPMLDPMTGLPVPPQMVPMEVEIIEQITPQDILTDGLDIQAVGVTYMTDEIVMRHQILQKLDMLVKYSQLPLINEQGEAVQPDFYKQIKRLMISFNDDKPDENFKPLPPPPPIPMGPSVEQNPNNMRPKQPSQNMGQQKPPETGNIQMQGG